MKIVITGGGTGGHFFPASIIAKKLQEENHSIFYFGNKDCIEYNFCQKENIPFYSIPSKSTLKKDIPFVVKNSVGVLKALNYLRKIKPDVIYSTGGYTTAPILAAAKLLNIPFILHEQNAVVGMVHRLFRSSAHTFIHSFPFEHNKNEKVIGNLSRFVGPIEREEKYILFMGGSGGANAINDLAVQYAKDHPEKEILLLSGRNYTVEEKVENLTIYTFTENMLDVLSKADIVVARAGSTTLVELSALGIPSIIIPMPNSADDHQNKNAEYYEWRNAIIKVNQDEYMYESLGNAVNKLTKKEKKTISDNFFKCYNQKAIQEVLDTVLKFKTIK